LNITELFDLDAAPTTASPTASFGAAPLQNPDIAGVTADSRLVRPGFLFAALKGVATDGRRFAADAVAKGAKVVWGGRARPDLGAGFFEPTVITGVNASMKLFQDETFGPIMTIQVVKDAEDAVAKANETQFGLAASVWTVDEGRGREFAGRLKAGTVMVNDVMSGFAIAEAPHGGSGLSGWGRTHGRAGLLEMVNVKYVDVDRMPGMEKPWWYRYGAEVEKAADAFLQFEFAGGVMSWWRHARKALGTIFRDHGL